MYIWFAGFLYYCESYRHIEILSSFANIHQNRLYFFGHIFLLYTQDYNFYRTCLHIVPLCIPVYSYHWFCRKSLYNNVLDIAMYTYRQNNHSHSWCNVRFQYYSMVLYNLQSIGNHRQVPSIRLHIHQYSFQSHRRHYFCKMSHILKIYTILEAA